MVHFFLVPCPRPPLEWSILRPLLLFVVACLYTPASAAADRSEVRTNYFRVTGSTPREIQRSLSAARPWKAPMNARTEWTIKWTCTTINYPGNSRLQNLDITTTITIILPKYYPSPDTPEPVKERWNQHLRALELHEAGHKDIALAATAELRRRIKEIPSASDENALKRLVTRLAREVTDNYRRQEIAYDKTTRHGQTQGASFP